MGGWGGGRAKPRRSPARLIQDGGQNPVVPDALLPGRDRQRHPLMICKHAATIIGARDKQPGSLIRELCRVVPHQYRRAADVAGTRCPAASGAAGTGWAYPALGHREGWPVMLGRAGTRGFAAQAKKQGLQHEPGQLPICPRWSLVQEDAPGFRNFWLRHPESRRQQQRKVATTTRIAHRAVADLLDASHACRVGEPPVSDSADGSWVTVRSDGINSIII